MASHRGNFVLGTSRNRSEERAAKWRRRFRRFALTPWQSNRIVGSIYNFFRSSAAAARAVKAATGAQFVGLGYSRQLRLEALESRQLLSANRYVNDTWLVQTNNVGGLGVDPGDIVMSDTGAGDTFVNNLVYGTDAFASIGSAVGASGDGVGDSVTVLKGVYSGTVNLNKSLSLLGQSAADVTVNAGGSPGVIVAAGKTAIVDDITFQNFGVAGIGVSVKGNLTLTDSIVNGGLTGVDVDGATTGHLIMSGTKVLGATVFGVNVGGGAAGSAAIDHSEISVAAGAAADVNVSDGSATITTSKLSTTSNTSKGLLVTSSGTASINASDLSGIASGGKAISNATVGAYVVDASDNWWGTTSESAALAMTEGNTDITPYRDSGTDTDGGAVGFVGDKSLLHVTTLGGQVGATGRIQEGINTVDVNGTVTLENGTYAEVANINKSSTLKATTLHGATIAPTSGAQQIVLTVSATNVTIDGVSIQVNQNDDAGIGGTAPIAPVGIGATPATTTDFNALTIKNTQITSIGDNPVTGGADPRKWSGTPSLTVAAAGIVLYDNPAGGIPAVTLQNNDVNIASGTSFFQRAVWLAQLNAQITGNTLVGVANDLIFQFPSGAASTISGNQFNGVHHAGGGGVVIGDSNSGAPVSITGNQFNTAASAFPSTPLQINRNAATGSPITISGNTFTGFTNIGIDIGGAQDVSVSGNILTPKAGATNFVGIAVDSQNASNNASTSTVINTTIDGNTINSSGVVSGTGIRLRNNLVGSTYGVGGVQIGTTADNIYDANLSTGVSAEGGIATVSDTINNLDVGVSVSGGTTTVAGSSLSGNTTGVLVSGTGTLTVGAGNSITGGTTGLKLDGAGVGLTGLTLNNLSISGQTGDYITLANSALDNQNIDGSGLTLGGTLVSSMTLAQLFAAEGKITDELDNNTLGLVVLTTDTIYVTPAASPTASDNDYTRIKNAIEAAGNNWNVYLQGTFDWSEPNARASWAAGNDGNIGTTVDNWEIAVPAGLSGVTLSAPGGLGSATIFNNGDIATANLEAVFEFDGSGSASGDNKNWTISNLEIFGFDLSIAMFNSGAGVDAFDGTKILNNHIKVAPDINATLAPTDVNQNIGIHYSFGANQTIQGNLIDLDQTPSSDSANGNYATSVGMQSNTSGGNVYNGLLIDNNTITVYGTPAADPGVILGIWENGHAHSSNITVSNNDFVNNTTGLNPASNLQRAFRVTSHSSVGSTVTYSGNTVDGANIGFQWIAGSDFTGNSAVNVTGNTLTNVGTGFLIQSNGVANLAGNSITNSIMSPVGIGIDVLAGSVVSVDGTTTDNSLVGLATGIRSAGSLTVTNNDASIHANTVGIDVIGGNANITNNHIFDNDIGIRFSGSATGSVTGNNFDGGMSADNDIDLQLLSSAGVVTLGAGNKFAGDVYFIDNASANSFDLAALGYGTTNYEGLDPTSLADAFTIEDHMRHKLDVANTSAGLIRTTAGQLYVTTLGTGPSDESIQNAIDAATAGDTINIQAGTYVGVGNRDLNVNKRLTIDGDTAATTIIDADGLNGVNINASGTDALNRLTVKDLTVTDASATGSGAFRIDSVAHFVTLVGVVATSSFYGLRASSGSDVDDLKIQNSQFTNDNIGLYSEADTSITNNQLFFNNVLLQNVTVSGNSSKGIYFEKANNLTLDTVTLTHAAADNGLDLNLKYGNFQNVSITGSSFTSTGTGTAAHIKGRNDAYGAGTDLVGLSITNSTFTSGTDMPFPPSGLSIGNAVSGITLSGDSFAGAGNGIHFYVTTPQALSLGNSKFESTLAGYVANTTPFAVDGTNATYGTVMGSGGVVGNAATPAQGFAIADKILDAVDVSGLGLVRIHPNQVFVTQNSFFPFAPFNTFTPSIQRGVDAATAGDTVYVQDGTYAISSAISVNKTLTLLGAQNGVDARTRTAVPETVIDASGVAGFPTSAIVIGGMTGGVVIDGFTIENVSGSGATTVGAIYMAPGSNSTTVRNNIIQNNHAGIFVENNSAVTPTLIERNLFINNNAPGAVSGTGIYADEYTTGGGLTNVVIQDNKFTNTSFVEDAWAIGMSNTGTAAFTDIDVLNNTVTNSGRGFYFFGTQNATVQGNVVDGANNHYALGIFAGATAATSNFSITGNTFKNAVGGSGILMDTGTGIVANNNILTGNKYGAKIEGGSISMAGNTLTGNDVGIQVSGGATVDAGGGALSSAGGNILTGYTGTSGNYAIEDLNLVASMHPDVYAKFNDFGPYVDISIIENYVFDDTDNPLNTKVIFTGALNQQPAPSVVFVDDDWVGSVLGVDKDGPSGASLGNGTAFGVDQFATIQDAINAVAATGTIWVYAGNYVQQLNINKAVSLKTANSGLAGNDGTRSAEAVIESGAATGALVEVSAAGVTIDGFTIDGNDQATRAVRVNEVDGAVIRNNVITAAVRGVQYNGAAAGNTGGVVTRNLIQNLTTGAGDSYGVLAFDSSYASVTNNVMTGVDVGIFEQYFYQPNGMGNSPNVISGNNITATLLGYGTNERSSAAAVTALSGNTYTISAGGVGVQLYNIYKPGGITLTGETITGAQIGVYAYVNGGSVSIANSSISGTSAPGSIGVQVTNYLADFASYATSFSNVTSSLSISGSNISGVATGVLVEDANADWAGDVDFLDDATGAVNVTIDTDTNIYNTGTGVHVTGPLANATITGNDNSIHNNVVGIDVDGGTATITGNHFYANATAIQFHNGGAGSVASNNFDGGMSADNATDLLIQNAGVAIGANNAFAGDTFFIDNQSTTDYDLSSNGTTFDQVNNFRIEDKIHHVVDIDLALANGLVTWVAGNIFVTNGGTDHSVQRGVDAASIGNTVNVEAGTYAEDLLIGTQGVKVIGAGAGSTIIDYAAEPGNNNGGVYIAANNVELRSLTVTQSAIDATPRYGVKVDFVNGVVIDGVTITNSYRTGLDLHGVTNVTVNDLVSQNNGGAGIFMTDVKGAALSNITTANNPWAGVSIATSGQYATLGTNGIVFSGTNSFGESNSANGGLQLEMYRYSTNTPYPVSWSSNPADGADVTIQSADFGYALSGSSFDGGTNTHGYVRFYKTLSQAENAAAGSPDHIDGNVAGLGTRYIQEADDSNGLLNSGPTNFYVFDNAGDTMSVQAAVNAALAGDTINVAAGTFVEDVTINKNDLTLKGAGSGVTSLIGAIGGGVSTITVAANNADISGFTITRDGNTVSQWNDPLNTAGIAIQGQAFTGAVIHDNILTGNRTAIDINNSNGHTIRNNVIDFNRTGLIFRNQTDNLLVTENFITNNWTVGVLFLDGSLGSNSPVQSAANSQFFNNNISGNWYGQVVDRQSGGLLPIPGTNIKDFRRNWLGTTSPVVTTANSAEPGYAAQIPVAYGGTATAPGGQPDIAGPASANIDITPFLTSGTDTNVETTLGRGTFGFQGNLSQLGVTISGPASVNEGAAYTLTLNPTNPGSPNITSWDITWGDGSPTQIVSGNPLSVNHVFVEGPSSPVITAVAHTTYGPANSNSVGVTVNNVVPTPSSITWLSSSINENQVANASLTISDPGTQDTFSVQVNWGEGSPDVLTLGLTNSSGTVGGTTYTWTAAAHALALSHQYLDDNPTGTPSDIYTLTVKVADDDMTGNFAGTLGVDYVQTTANLTVNNVAPTAVAYSLPASVNEGSLATINITGQTDVGTLDTFTYSYVVKKNGGTFATSGGFIGNSFNFTPDDMDPGFTWTVEVQAKDDDGGLSPVNIQSLNVVDVAPTVNIVSLTSPINENTSTTLVFNLVDPGAGDRAATGQVSINWGDGSPTTLINSGPDLLALQSGGTVTRLHTYADDNPPVTSSDIYSITFNSIQLSPTLIYTNMALAGGSVPRTVTVNNVAPTGVFLTSTPTVSAGDPVSVNWIAQSDVPSDVTAGLKYTYFIDANTNNLLDSGEEILPAASFGDGTYAGSTLSDSVTIPGTYFVTPGVIRVASQIRDDDSGVTTEFVDITVLPTTFRVTSLVPTDTGFIVTFNRAADTVPVNLYAGRLASGGVTTDTADVTLVGSGGVGNVRGSIVWSADRTSFEFIKTGYINSTDLPTAIGGVLAPANYTVTIESGDTAFQDQAAGEDLDGDGNLVAGGNFSGSFTVAATSARVVSIPDFSRGSSATTGQTITVPLANNAAPGIPIMINNGNRVAAVDLDVVYDPALIDITNVVVGADTAGWTVTSNLTTPGRAIITIFNPSGLSTGVKEIARLIANVDNGAAYGGSEVLRIENLSVHDVDNLPLASRGDSALHKAIFVGDANASGAYTGLDASWIAEVRVNTYTGFGEYPITDPIIVADVTGSRTIDGLDSSWVSQKGLLPTLRPEIPNIPAGGLPISASVDPTIAIPLNILASPGHTVHVPLNITDSAAGLSGFNVLVNYDTSKLDLPSGLNAGGITVAGMFASEGGWSLDSYVDDATGQIGLSFYRIGGSASTAGQIADIAFVVSPSATGGVTPLDVNGPTVDPPFAFTHVDGSILIDAAAPTVNAVRVSSSAWSNDFKHVADTGGLDLGYIVPDGANQLSSLPWTNVNKLMMSFSEDVVVSQSDLILRGVNTVDYTSLINGFSYNSLTHTATWTLSSNLPVDKYLAVLSDNVKDTAGNALDGNWTNGGDSYPSGNGSPGPRLEFRFNVVPGDANQNGSVSGTDVGEIRLKQFQSISGGMPSPTYSIFDDLDGNGVILGSDVGAAQTRQFTQLPAGEPTPPPGAGAGLLQLGSGTLATPLEIADRTQAIATEVIHIAVPPVIGGPVRDSNVGTMSVRSLVSTSLTDRVNSTGSPAVGRTLANYFEQIGGNHDLRSKVSHPAATVTVENIEFSKEQLTFAHDLALLESVSERYVANDEGFEIAKMDGSSELDQDAELVAALDSAFDLEWAN